MILTARPMMPVMIPVLIADDRYGDPKANSETESGFIPFFRCPIWISQIQTNKHKLMNMIHPVIKEYKCN